MKQWSLDARSKGQPRPLPLKMFREVGGFRWTRALRDQPRLRPVKKWRRGQTADGPVPAWNVTRTILLFWAEEAHRI